MSISGSDPARRTAEPFTYSIAGSFLVTTEPPPFWLYAAAEPPPPPQRRIISDIRLQRLSRKIHELGEQPLYQLLREIIAGRDPGEQVERYADLPADFIKAFGGDRFPGLRLVDPEDVS